MENFKTPVPVEWQNQRVLTTAQLAEYYECDVNNIKKNFNKNKDRFVAGKHYFKLEGDVLKSFRSNLQFDEINSQNLHVTEGDLQNLHVTEGNLQNLHSESNDLQISPKTRTLYLWTERGAARHAKMLSTDKAWEVFELLEDNYFNRVAETAPVPAKKARRPLSPSARVYALLMSDGTVKIGHSDNIRDRIVKIEYKTGLKVTDVYFTLPVSRETARLIEWACQKKFSSRKVEGEFFSVDFEEVCKVIDSFVKVEVESGERVLKITITMKELTDNQTFEKALLIKVANIFVGRIFE